MTIASTDSPKPSSRRPSSPGGSGGGMSGVEINGMLEKSNELDRLREELENVFDEINKLHEMIKSTPDVVEMSMETVLSRLRELYCHAKELSENEFSVSTALMGQLDAFLQSGPSAKNQKKIEVNERKKKSMKTDSDNAPFNPAASMRNQLELAANLKGKQVAARVSSDDAESDEWFIVKVICFNKDTKEFEVIDEEPDEDEDSTQRKYKLPLSHIIPFPKRNDPSSAPDFPPGRHVLAVYPGTTALYKATVVNPHRKRKSDDYILEFDDDEEDDGSLPQRSVPFDRVVPLPEGHHQ